MDSTATPTTGATVLDSAEINFASAFFGSHTIFGAEGGFVATYVDGALSFRGQVLSPTGSKIGPSFVWSGFDGASATIGPGFQLGSAGQPDFGFVLLGTTFGDFGQPDQASRAFVRRFDGGFTPAGAEVLLSDSHADEYGIAIVVDPSSDQFRAWWIGEPPSSTLEGCIFNTRAFDANGDPLGPATEQVPYTDDICRIAVEATVTPDGDVMVVWPTADQSGVAPLSMNGIIYPKMYPQP